MEGGRFESSNNNPSHLKMCREICENLNVLPKFNKWGKRVWIFLNIFVATIYHPYDIKENGESNETLSLLMNLIPKMLNLLDGMM